jgi:hypothetical membrane protein
MKKRKTIHYWQVMYVLLIVFGILNVLTGIVSYQTTEDVGWIALAISGGFLSIVLLVVEPKFD